MLVVRPHNTEKGIVDITVIYNYTEHLNLHNSRTGIIIFERGDKKCTLKWTALYILIPNR